MTDRKIAATVCRPHIGMIPIKMPNAAENAFSPSDWLGLLN
jgi:hypothetical protein